MSIRRWLGWSDRFHQTDAALERAMSAVETARPDTETEIRTLIGYCDAQDAAIRGATQRLKALKVGPIELPGEGEIDALRALGSQYSKQIATALGVEMRSNPWYPGTASVRATWDGPKQGGGMLPFG